MYGPNVFDDILYAKHLGTPDEDYNVERWSEILLHVGHSCLTLNL